MMFSAIYTKEWFKLRKPAYALCAAALVIGYYFWFNLSGQYANIEPESMMWYRLAHLGDKPYSWLLYCFVLTGAIVAGLQYVPEATGKKVRILTHLPVSLNKVVVKHIFAGVVMILVANGILSAITVLAFSVYYPSDIIHTAIKDMLFGQLPAIAIYLGFAAVIVESDWRRKSSKMLLSAIVTFVLLKDQYQPVDLLGIVAIIWLVLPIIDSFLSVKTRRIESKVYLLSIPAVFVLFAVLAGTRLYNEYAVSHTKYYVFYSPVLNDFVYQENGPNHTFFYGTPSAKMEKDQFEESLPFVYWKNLDIQGKLPVDIDGVSYDKNKIRKARMSLQYDASRLTKPEVTIYPFFNPISHKGSIRFPENMFSLKSDRFEVYAAETAEPNVELAKEVNGLADKVGIDFPITEVWGKTTNMKPFDWGYFIKDSAGEIFNLNRADDEAHLKAVPVPEEVGDIVYIQVSENRHKKFYGYAISAASKVYLISYPDYQFIPLEMDGFDYRTMSFQLLSDPLYYVMRFDDGEKYSAVRYSKDYQMLDSAVFE
ncbi:DUF4857 domain-containing protein [Vibrio sp. JC009]|uniref:DUF4857 domain-containing protein n=1 Tax=Vibrio sp. JC009 TaxID=2912314 RepID=UPI0023B1ED4E|nr:DUF4857 domain-containing protein [Vibrio sp. JC009]WED24679.1 DUF4857 domain-containing protein [Vibrio sp. JC009]